MRVASPEKTTKLTMNPQVVNFLLQAHTTNENIAKTKGKIFTTIQPPHRTLSQYAKKFMAIKLHCKDIHEEQDLNEIFIKKLDKFIRQSMGEYWFTPKTASLYDLALQATSLVEL